MLNIAVVPARKGSKRFPGKNRLKLNGKSLVEIAIGCAIDAKIFDKIILTTDDEFFFELQNIYPGIDIRIRPPFIAQDTSTPYEVLMDVIQFYDIHEDLRFCYLQPTSPLRRALDLKMSLSDNAVSIYCDEENKFNNKHNVFEYLEKNGINNNNFLSLHNNKNYYFNGMFYWVRKKILLNQKGFIGGSTKFVVTDPERSLDIDYTSHLNYLNKDLFYFELPRS